ncbi:MAG: pyocin knob domain-containing protein [Bacilli bacterium]
MENNNFIATSNLKIPKPGLNDLFNLEEHWKMVDAIEANAAAKEDMVGFSEAIEDLRAETSAALSQKPSKLELAQEVSNINTEMNKRARLNNDNEIKDENMPKGFRRTVSVSTSVNFDETTETGFYALDRLSLNGPALESDCYLQVIKMSDTMIYQRTVIHASTTASNIGKSHFRFLSNGTWSVWKLESDNETVTTKIAELESKTENLETNLSQNYTTKTEAQELKAGVSNHVANGSFEHGLWLDPKTATVVWDAERSGNVLKVVGGFGETIAPVQDLLDMQPDTDYVVSGSIKLEDQVLGGTNPLVAILIQYFQDNTFAGEFLLSPQYTAPSGKWIHYEKRLKTKASGWNRMRIRCWVRDITGNVYFDHIKVEKGFYATGWVANYSDTVGAINQVSNKINTIETSLPTTYATKKDIEKFAVDNNNYILNSSFDFGLWNDANGVATNLGGAATIQSAPSSKSNNSLLITGRPTERLTMFQSCAEVDSEEDFVFSFRVKTENVSILDGSQVSVSIGFENAGTFVKSEIIYVDIYKTNLDWHLLQKRITNKGITWDRVRIVLFVSTINGNFYFDKFKLEKGNVATEWVASTQDLTRQIISRPLPSNGVWSNNLLHTGIRSVSTPVSSDLNNYLNSGFYEISTGSISNSPSGAGTNGALLQVIAGSTGQIYQRFSQHDTTRNEIVSYERFRTSNTWSSWRFENTRTNANRITVSTTAPANPQNNDIWIQI